MSEKTRQRPGRKPKEKIKHSDVQGGKFLAQIMDLLASLHDHCPDPKRRLHYDQYCAWLLIYFFTPALDSLRGLQQASDIDSLRRRLKLPRFSLGSFSEAGNVFDPALLAGLIEELGQALPDIEPDPRLRGLQRRPTAVDGTFLRGMPKMVWALWRDEHTRGAKLHLQLDLLRGAPERASLTNAQAPESEQLRQSLQGGRLYIEDRGYFNFDLMSDILKAGSSFVGRARASLVYETLEERPLSESQRREGIVADRLVRAGCNGGANAPDQPLRLVEIRGREEKAAKSGERQSDHHVLLLTDCFDLDADTIALLYRYRWQIELFFRWFKKILQAQYLLSLSENGLTIVMYCALIASMLITLWSGRKPTKRTFEMLCFYFSGWASEAELLAHIGKLKELKKTK